MASACWAILGDSTSTRPGISRLPPCHDGSIDSPVRSRAISSRLARKLGGMGERGRYLLSYDVVGARYGQRVQRHVRKHASMLLESLYQFNGDAESCQDLLQQLRQLAGPSAPNVVGWRIRGDEPMRYWGTALPPAGILDFSLAIAGKSGRD